MAFRVMSLLMFALWLPALASAGDTPDVFEAMFPHPAKCELSGTLYYDEETRKVENNLQDGKDHPSPLWTYTGPVEVTELGSNSAVVKIPQSGNFFGAPYQAISIPAGRGNGFDYDYKMFFDAAPEQVQALIKKRSKRKLKIYNEDSTDWRPNDDFNVGFLQRTKQNSTIYICHSVWDF